MGESIEPERATHEGGPWWRRFDRWHAIACLLLTIAALITFRDVLEAGPASSAIVSSSPERRLMQEGDVVFEAWLTARNARTIATAPHRLYDTEHCAPAENTLTLGVPMITMGLLAVPVAIFTENPALAYNFASIVLLILSGLAMYLLVRDWTGIPQAGVVAGLLYAFSPIRVGFNITHPSVWDSGWLVFALFFSHRLFAHGRWRDAIGLAAACSLQIGASFYMLLASALMAPTFAAWLLYRYGLRNVRWTQLAFVVGWSAVVAVLLLGPYLNAREAGAIGGRTIFYYAQWAGFLPGNALFLGWGALALGLVGLLVPRRRLPLEIGGDPRWPLVVGALITTLIAAGPYNNQLLRLIWAVPPFELPNLYLLLVSIVPGLDSIRVIARLAVAAQVTVCVLAGLGAAWLIKSAGQRADQIALAMIVVAMLLIVPEPVPRQAVEVRVDSKEIEFFRRLEEMGNHGPILEVPSITGIERTFYAPRRILPAAYHHRRVSTCFGSFRGPSLERVSALIDRLPEPTAVDELRQLGFTTLVLNKAAVPFSQVFRRRIFAGGTARLTPLIENDQLVAFDLLRSPAVSPSSE